MAAQGRAGSFHGESLECHTQRDIPDPASEAESGIDFDNVGDDDVGVDDFLKITDPKDVDGPAMHEWLNDSYGCSTYVAKCKETMVAGDHQKASESLNRAMAYHAKVHANFGPFP